MAVFFNETVQISIKNSQVHYQGSNQQYFSIGSDNGLAPAYMRHSASIS